MWYYIIGFLVLIVIIKMIIAGTVKGFTKGIAKAQLKTYNSLRKRNPELTKKELYVRMITNRPGYSREEAIKIIELGNDITSKKLNALLNPNTNNEVINLRKVTLNLVWYEYRKRTGRSIGIKYNIMEDAVNDIIPYDL